MSHPTEKEADMRYWTIGLSMLCLAMLSGCIAPWLQPHPNEGIAVASTASQDQLLAALNGNADRIQSIECTQVDLDCRQGLQSFGLTAKLACEKPQSFRMAAFFSGSQMVDMGSNDQEFWFWISKADPPYLYHCAYSDFNAGRARLPLPFQPEWVMEALGMAHYDPATCRVVDRGRNIQIVQNARGPNGQPVTKVTLVNRNAANQVQVVGHQLIDARGKMICEARVMKLQKDPTGGGVLPELVSLNWPAERITLKLRLEGTHVNGSLDQDRRVALFTRPSLGGAVPGYDLARGPDQPNGRIQRTNARGYRQ